MFVLAIASAVLAATGYAVAHHVNVPALVAVVVTGLLCGGAHGFLYPALAALVADDAPPSRRGAVIGIFSAIFLCGQAGGAFAFGWFAHGLGYAIAWTVLTGLVLVGSVISIGLERSVSSTA
jgi:MFS family permease